MWKSSLNHYGNVFFSIHPRDKQDVAQRLVLSSLAVAYNRNPGKFQGPMVSAFYIDIGFFTLGLEFDNGSSALEVRSTNGFEVNSWKVETNILRDSDEKHIYKFV